jgi:hypothetical protein
MASYAWWIEWYYNKSNVLEGMILTARTEPEVTGGSDIVAVTGPYSSRASALAELDLRAGMHALTGLPAIGAITGAALGAAASGLTGNVTSPSANAIATGETAGTSVANPLSGLIAALTSRNTWIRIAEGVLGVGLIIAAVSHLAANTNVGNTIIETGKKAARAASIAG